LAADPSWTGRRTGWKSGPRTRWKPGRESPAGMSRTGWPLRPWG